MKHLKKIFNSLIFPSFCIACDQKKYTNDILGLCEFCKDDLPFTHHFEIRDNLLEQRFWGRIPLHAGASLLFFQKNGFVQHLIYRIKYESAKSLAIHLGSLLGRALKESEAFDSVSFLVPVPLHTRKKRRRGYNQCDLICEGICSVWDKPIFNGLKRRKHTKSQTRMGRFERLKNLSGAMVAEKLPISGPHFLIIDDVLTTGTTLEICALSLLEVYPNAKISVATLAFADLW